MRSFLYAIGLPISLLTCSLSLLYSTKFITIELPRKYFSIISLLFLWSSFFQFIWIFWDRQDLPKETYYTFIIVMSFLTSFFFQKAIVQRKESLVKLQGIINSLSRFSIITVKKYIPAENEGEYKKGLVKALKKGIDE